MVELFLKVWVVALQNKELNRLMTNDDGDYDDDDESYHLDSN